MFKTYIHTYLPTYLHTYTHTYIYIQVQYINIYLPYSIMWLPALLATMWKLSALLPNI